MKVFARLSLTALMIFLVSQFTFATWSIIVIDPKTKEIGIAGASCTRSVYGIGSIVPGKGAIVVQAMSNGMARLDGFKMIMKEVSPAEILEKLKHPKYNPEEQQYAILFISSFHNILCGI